MVPAFGDEVGDAEETVVHLEIKNYAVTGHELAEDLERIRYLVLELDHAEGIVVRVPGRGAGDSARKDEIIVFVFPEKSRCEALAASLEKKSEYRRRGEQQKKLGGKRRARALHRLEHGHREKRQEARLPSEIEDDERNHDVGKREKGVAEYLEKDFENEGKEEREFETVLKRYIAPAGVYEVYGFVDSGRNQKKKGKHGKCVQ